MQHLVAGSLGQCRGPVGPQTGWALRQGHQQGGLCVAQIQRRFAQVGPAGHFHALHLATHRGVVEVQGEDVVLAQVPFQLQGACHLAQFGAHCTGGRATFCTDVRTVHFQNAGHLHGQRGAARHHMPMLHPLAQRPHQRQRVDAGMPVKPAVLVVQQGLQVQGRHGFGRDGVAQGPVGTGPGAQWRAVIGQHHQCAGCVGSLKRRCGQWKSPIQNNQYT